jgi:hypothetical protein
VALVAGGAEEYGIRIVLEGFGTSNLELQVVIRRSYRAVFVFLFDLVYRACEVLLEFGKPTLQVQ